jgi:hypothetical protein
MSAARKAENVEKPRKGQAIANLDLDFVVVQENFAGEKAAKLQVGETGGGGLVRLRTAPTQNIRLPRPEPI